MENINSLLLLLAIVLSYNLTFATFAKSIICRDLKKPKINIWYVSLSQIFMFITVILIQIWNKSL